MGTLIYCEKRSRQDGDESSGYPTQHKGKDDREQRLA